MPITDPSTAQEGDSSVAFVGTNLSSTAPIYIVATNGSKEIRKAMPAISQGPTGATVACELGLSIKISLVPPLAIDGVSLTGPEWSLRWETLADDDLTPVTLPLVVTPPDNIQQREIENSEKFGGVLEGINFGAQDQLYSEIVTSTNTIKLTESNGKATGFFDGIEREMTEVVNFYIFTASDAKWRKRVVTITDFSQGLWFDGELWADSEPYID